MKIKMQLNQSFCIYPNPRQLQRSTSISTNLYTYSNVNVNVNTNVIENTNPNIVGHKVVLGTIVNKPKKSVTFFETKNPLEKDHLEPIDFKELDNKVEKLLSNINMIKGAIALYSMNNDEASYLKLVKYINYMTELQHQFDNIICK